MNIWKVINMHYRVIVNNSNIFNSKYSTDIWKVAGIQKTWQGTKGSGRMILVVKWSGRM